MSGFIYLLNALEGAAQSENPFERGYADKRRAVLEYVEKLESTTRSESKECAPRWVPCIERTPEQDHYLWAVLTESVRDGRVTGYIPTFEYYHHLEGWATDEKITHWLDLLLPKLPEAPK